MITLIFWSFCINSYSSKNVLYLCSSFHAINNVYTNLSTKLYDKRDDLNFSIVNFPYLCSNKPWSPAYAVFVSYLIIYARMTCSTYKQFLQRGKLLTYYFIKQDHQQSWSKFQSFAVDIGPCQKIQFSAISNADCCFSYFMSIHY